MRSPDRVLLVPRLRDAERQATRILASAEKRDAALAIVERALGRFADRVLPRDAPRELLPGVGAILTAPGVPVLPGASVYGARTRTVGRTNGSSQGRAPVDTSHLDQTGIAAFRKQHGLSGETVTVGVIDSGLDGDHPDLSGRTSASAEVARNGQVTPAPPVDHFGHGTQVCGVIAGRQTGVAPNARLASANIFPDPARNEYGVVQFAAALNWLVATAGADVVNVSAGHRGEVPEYLPLVRFARERFGVLVIAAIGNSGSAPNVDDSPGNLLPVFGVGACNSVGAVWLRSNWRTHDGVIAAAPKPEMCAPGVSVCTCRPGGGYTAATATSIAAAVISGVAALCLEQNPALRTDPTALTRTLLSKAKPVSGAAGRAGHGVLFCGADPTPS